MRRIFLLLIVFGTGKLCAQKVTAQWGYSQDYGYNQFPPEVIGSDEEGYYVVTKKAMTWRYAYFLERINNDNKSAWKTELDLPEGGLFNYGAVKIVDGNLLLFSTPWDKKSKTKSVYVSVLNDTGGQKSDPVLLNEIQNVEIDCQPFTFYFSHDTTAVIVSYVKRHGDTKPPGLSIVAVGSEGEISWKKDFPVPPLDSKIYLSEIKAIDDQIYVIASIKIGENEKATFRYFLLRYTSGRDEPKEYELSVANAFISDVYMHIGEDNKLVLAGFYSRENARDAEGFFYQVIGAESLKPELTRNTDFNSATLEQIRSEKLFQATSGLQGFSIRDILQRPDGNYFVVAKRYVYGWGYGMMIFEIDEKGTPGLITRIRRMAYGSYDGGFVTVPYKDKLLFFYNDNRANLGITNEGEIEKLTSFNKSIITMATADVRAGTFTKKELFPESSGTYYVNSGLSYDLGSGQLLLCVDKKKPAQIFLVRLKIE
jgi:hypothetical protein